MTDYTICRLEEQNLRVDTQEGVCGIIPDEPVNTALVALYLQLGAPDQLKVHKKLKEILQTSASVVFITMMTKVAEQMNHPTPEGGTVSDILLEIAGTLKLVIEL